VSGRDLRDGGTWMGFTPSGRFAMLTNLRDPSATPPPLARSRGALVMDWLTSTLAVDAWRVQRDWAHYAGFNLIAGDWPTQQCHYLSSHSAMQALEPGNIYGLSNAAIDTPWPKTVQLKGVLQEKIKNDMPLEALQSQLQRALMDETRMGDAQLPHTGVPLEVERALSSVFVRHPQPQADYGTRTSLVATLDGQQTLHLHEATHAHGAQVRLRLPWPQSL
ncbi:MAG: NRDE family protein, partial [Burkholderiaceae bacterium]